MIRRTRAHPTPRRRSAARGELVGMDTGFETGPRCRPRESRLDSSGVKHPASQNTSHHSARPSAATAESSRSRCTRRSRRGAPELSRDVVRAQEGRHDIDEVAALERADRAQHLQLGSDGQAVAALGFARWWCRGPASRRVADARRDELRSVAARVGATVFTMPPPSAAIVA